MQNSRNGLESITHSDPGSENKTNDYYGNIIINEKRENSFRIELYNDLVAFSNPKSDLKR